MERARKETLVNLITIFGVISILASVLDIVQTLSSGGTFIWTTTIVTNVALLLVLGSVSYTHLTLPTKLEV